LYAFGAIVTKKKVSFLLIVAESNASLGDDRLIDRNVSPDNSEFGPVNPSLQTTYSPRRFLGGAFRSRRRSLFASSRDSFCLTACLQGYSLAAS
jgi:hypothetical protein